MFEGVSRTRQKPISTATHTPHSARSVRSVPRIGLYDARLHRESFRRYENSHGATEKITNTHISIEKNTETNAETSIEANNGDLSRPWTRHEGESVDATTLEIVPLGEIGDLSISRRGSFLHAKQRMHHSLAIDESHNRLAGLYTPRPYTTPVRVTDRRSLSPTLRSRVQGNSLPPRLRPCDFAAASSSVGSLRSPARKIERNISKAQLTDLQLPSISAQNPNDGSLAQRQDEGYLRKSNSFLRPVMSFNRLDQISPALVEDDKLNYRQVRDSVCVIFEQLDPDKNGYVWFDDWKDIILSLEQTSKYGLNCTEVQAKQIIQIPKPDHAGVLYYRQYISPIAEKFFAYQEEAQTFVDLTPSSGWTPGHMSPTKSKEDPNTSEAYQSIMKISTDTGRLHGYSKSQFTQKLSGTCAQLDFENTGRIDRTSLRKALSQANLGLSTKEINFLSAQAPADSFGFIDYRTYVQDSFEVLQNLFFRRYHQLSTDLHHTRHILIKGFQAHMKMKSNYTDRAIESAILSPSESAFYAKDLAYLVLHNEILSVLQNADLGLTSSQIHLLARLATPNESGAIDYREFCSTIAPLLFSYYANRYASHKAMQHLHSEQ